MELLHELLQIHYPQAFSQNEGDTTTVPSREAVSNVCTNQSEKDRENNAMASSKTLPTMMVVVLDF